MAHSLGCRRACFHKHKPKGAQFDEKDNSDLAIGGDVRCARSGGATDGHAEGGGDRGRLRRLDDALRRSVDKEGQTAFKKVATATTTAGGVFSYAAKPTIDTNYQAKNKGATSSTVPVKVAPVLSLQKRSLGKFKVSVTAAQSFVGKYVVFQRLRNSKWVTLKKVTLATVATTTAPTQVTASTFKIKLPAKLRVRSILPAAQAATCYLPAKSKVIRS
jgi:hypothetical protein